MKDFLNIFWKLVIEATLIVLTIYGVAYFGEHEQVIPCMLSFILGISATVGLAICFLDNY